MVGPGVHGRGAPTTTSFVMAGSSCTSMPAGGSSPCSNDSSTLAASNDRWLWVLAALCERFPSAMDPAAHSLIATMIA